MVSFQCEGCGDVLTKKKLDPHRNQCRGGAVFTCIDCMTTFYGTDYRAHTSCITEDQKYQGALYREKPSKASKRKSVSIVEPDNAKALVPRQAYVEDVADFETPPHVPTPPPAVPDSSNRDSVFDYMVDDQGDTNTPRINFAKDKEEMAMKRAAPSIFSGSRPSSRNGEEHQHSRDYEENGYTWGAEPVKPRGVLDMNGSALSLEFMTPAAKEAKSKLGRKERPQSHSRTNSGSEKKRKRDDQVHELEGDTLMVDTSKPDTPAVIHSGLTGGMNRMMSQDEAYPFRRSPGTEDRRDAVIVKERSNRRSQKMEDPTSPLKRTRHTKEENSNGLGISIKGRAVKALSMVGGALLAGQGASEMSNNRTRRRASSSDHGQSLTRIQNGEKRERKKHKVQRHNGTASANIRHEPRTRHRYSDESRSPSQERSVSRKPKAIEYRKHDDSGSESDSETTRATRKSKDNGDMVVFGAEEKTRRACRSFLANAPGLDSDKGYSIHKMLKRWHKHNDVRSSSSKIDEEHDLWRALRVRRNEKGEFVVCF